MRRFVALLAAVAAVALWTAQTTVAQKAGKGLKLGEKFEGELGEQQKKPLGYKIEDLSAGGVSGVGLYMASLPIRLKAGQELSIVAAVAGSDRYVGLQVFDPGQKRILVDSKKQLEFERYHNRGQPVVVVSSKAAAFKIEEVGATGTYTIVVASDRVGAFTVKATSTALEVDREALEQDLKEAKKRVEEIEAKLKALDDKPKKKLRER
jgi:hypothetical protein